MKKIVHIITDSNVGGAGKLLCYLIGASDKNEYEYSVLLPVGSALKPLLEKAGAHTYEIPQLCGSRSPKAVKEMTAKIREIAPDIVHTHSSLSGQTAARRAGIKKCIMTKHTSTPPPAPLMHFPLHQLSRLYWRKISCCIATDDSAALSMMAAGFPEKRIKTVYNGCPDLAKEENHSKIAAEELKKQLRIPEGRLIVGYFGRLEPEKGPDRLLAAAAMCRRFTEDVHFLICGGGSMADELLQKAEKYGIKDTVSFTGFVQDTAAYMRLCGIIASPSVGVETSSLSLCEGLSLGLVPVVTDVGGSRNLIGNCGICVPPDDPAAIYEAVMQLARDPDLMALYSRKARARFCERCTAARMAKETCRIYDEVAGKRGGC